MYAWYCKKGLVMGGSVKKIVTVAAMIAVPYAAPQLAGAIGLSGGITNAAIGVGMNAQLAGTIGAVVGNAVTGSVIGGLTTKAAGGSYATGRDLGMATGALSGLTQPFASTSTASAGGNTPTLYGQYIADTQATVPINAAVTGNAITAGATPAATNAAAATNAVAASGTNLTSALKGLTSPDTLMRITTLALAESPDVSGLSPEEAQLVQQRKAELAEMARTNKSLFDQQVAMANEFLQASKQAQANPAGAYAETAIQTERQIAENTRGLSSDAAAAVARQAKIAGSAAGSVAAAAETDRGQAAGLRFQQAALDYMPDSAPEGAAGLTLPLMQDLAERRRQAQSDLVYGTTSAFGYGGEKEPFLQAYGTKQAGGIGGSGAIG